MGGMVSPASPAPGRGTALNPANRFEPLTVTPDPDYAELDEHGVPVERAHPRTQFYVDATESVLTQNDSPDIRHAWGLNPYRGCEHGCAYCFARPYHDYLGWSSGLEFETKILVKSRAPALLRAELAARKWKPEPILMSGVTDCYQPAERHFRLTRQCLEVLAEFREAGGVAFDDPGHPCSTAVVSAAIGRPVERRDGRSERRHHRNVELTRGRPSIEHVVL